MLDSHEYQYSIFLLCAGERWCVLAWRGNCGLPSFCGRKRPRSGYGIENWWAWLDEPRLESAVVSIFLCICTITSHRCHSSIHRARQQFKINKHTNIPSAPSSCSHCTIRQISTDTIFLYLSLISLAIIVFAHVRFIFLTFPIGQSMNIFVNLLHCYLYNTRIPVHDVLCANANLMILPRSCANVNFLFYLIRSRKKDTHRMNERKKQHT